MEQQDANRYGVLPRERTTYPRTSDDFAVLASAIDEFVVDHTIQPFFDRNSLIFTQGSCFAENLHNALSETGYPSYYNKMTEALNSPLANWVYLKKLANNPDDPVHQKLAQANVFILTIGVGPCWFRKADDAFVFQPDMRNMADFYQRTLKVEECKDALSNALALIRHINPTIRVVLTLSPVPLARTFEFASAVVADCISKSTLRAAIHETIGTGDENAMYFPSFEVVRWIGGHHGGAFGAEDGLTRHISLDYIRAIIGSFIRNYSKDANK